MSGHSAENGLLLPPRRHVCDLPSGDGHVSMTLARCPECATWWFWDWDPGGDLAGWPYRTWRQVRWYHFRLRRQTRPIPPASTDTTGGAE